MLARTERGTLSAGADPVLVQHLIPGIVESEGARWPGTKFELRISPNLPTVSADPTYVEQVIRNLVGNGAKYSPGGATVTVQAEQVDGFVDLRILDEGPGIASDEVDRLFELFYRSPTTAAQSAGAGSACSRVARSWSRWAAGSGPVRARPAAPSSASPCPSWSRTTSDRRNELRRVALRALRAIARRLQGAAMHLTMPLRPPATHAGPHRCRWTAGCVRRTIATAQGHR